MKTVFALIALLSVAVPAAAQSQGMGGMDMKNESKKAAAKSHKGVGVVKAVDREKGTVSVAHEPIKSMNWSSMTMTFKAKDKKLLDNLEPGKKVEFDFVQQGKDYVITSVK